MKKQNKKRLELARQKVKDLNATAASKVDGGVVQGVPPEGLGAGGPTTA